MTPEKQEKKGCYLMIDLVICSNMTNLLFAPIAPQAASQQQKHTEGDYAGDECTEFCSMFSRKKTPHLFNSNLSLNGMLKLISWIFTVQLTNEMSGQLGCQDNPLSCCVLCRQNCYKYVPTALGISTRIPSLDIEETQHSTQWTECVACIQYKRKRDFTERW